MTHSKNPARRRLTRSPRAVLAFLPGLATHGPFCGSAVTAILHWILAAATAAAVLASALLLSVVSMLPSAGVAQAAPCSGKIINPITDVCWSCMFPITLGVSIPISGKGSLPDVRTDANPVCVCGENVNIEAGLNFGFWEPLRTAEIVRHPYCFPSLGGVEFGGAMESFRASAHGRTSRTDGNHRRTAFWQTHWYHTPWLFVLEALMDNGCLEQAPWDLAYMSELDPLWDDSLASFLLAPDAALFTAGAAFGACAIDCSLATAGLPNNELYWCSGCQGRVFPLSGWMAAQVSPLQAWHLMAHRFAVKLSREGILWSAHGERGHYRANGADRDCGRAFPVRFFDGKQYSGERRVERRGKSRARARGDQHRFVPSFPFAYPSRTFAEASAYEHARSLGARAHAEEYRCKRSGERRAERGEPFETEHAASRSLCLRNAAPARHGNETHDGPDDYRRKQQCGKQQRDKVRTCEYLPVQLYREFFSDPDEQVVYGDCRACGGACQYREAGKHGYVCSGAAFFE